MQPGEDKLPEDPKLKELAGRLRSLHDRAGVEQPDENLMTAPTLRVGGPRTPHPPHLVAPRAAELLAGLDLLFMRGPELGKVHAATGQWEPMTPGNFRSWIRNTAGITPISHFDKETGRAVETGLTADMAKVILDSDDVRRKMPVIEGINYVKMPAFRTNGEGKLELELLRPGYDRRHRVFTALTGPDFEEGVPAKEGIEYLWKLFRYFRWRNPLRDWPIVLAAMVTMFGRGIYRGKAPAFIINANIQASGKSRIAEYICWVVHNHAYTRPLLENADEKLQDTLETAAKGQKPYVFFDNVDWKGKTIVCPLLDEWITTKGKEFRIKGVSMDWEGAVRAVTLLTGNTLRLSDDLQRRALMADIWNPLAAEERPPLPKDAVLLDDDFFEDQHHRSRGLAALWSIIRQWNEDGRPRHLRREVASFEQWGRVVPEIVAHAGRLLGLEWNCLLPPENAEIGSKQSREYSELGGRAIAAFGLDPEEGMREVFEVTVAQLAGVARRFQVATEKLWPEMTIEDVRSTENEKGGFRPKVPGDLVDEEIEEEIRRQASEYLSPKTRSSFGTAVKNKLNERHILGPDGFHYEWRAVPNAAPARYRVTKVKS